MEKTRCAWAKGTDLMIRYHDEEWGVPRSDDAFFYEFMVLESAQAGLSWSTILNRREGYRACFSGFDTAKVAAYTEADVERLMADARIIRNRRKIESAVSNARVFLEVAAKHGSFAAWFWRYAGDRPIEHECRSVSDVPPKNELSDRAAREMKKMGFRFLGSTVLYSYMQAAGLINDHLTSCFRYEEVRELGQKFTI